MDVSITSICVLGRAFDFQSHSSSTSSTLPNTRPEYPVETYSSPSKARHTGCRYLGYRAERAEPFDDDQIDQGDDPQVRWRGIW